MTKAKKPTTDLSGSTLVGHIRAAEHMRDRNVGRSRMLLRAVADDISEMLSRDGMLGEHEVRRLIEPVLEAHRAAAAATMHSDYAETLKSVQS